MLLVSEIMEEKKLDFINDYIDVFKLVQKYAKFSFNNRGFKKLKPIIIKRHYGASLRDLLGGSNMH